MPVGRFALFISLLPIGGWQLAAQSPGQSVPTLRTTARMVVLDVVVTDKSGHPVKGLKQPDFALTEDGVPQRLASFTEHDDVADAPPAQPSEKLPPNTFEDHAPLTGNGAITVILFDELSFEDAAYARYEVESYLKTLTPGMPICIFKLDWKGLHLIQDFTTDPQALREAVSSKRNAQGMPPPPSVGLSPSGLLGSSMRELASYLSGFAGRKNLIWFTDGPTPDVGSGLPGSPFPDLSNFVDDASGVLDVLTLSRVALYPVDARGLVVGRRAGFEVMVQDGDLAEVAAQTGGRAFYNTNGLKEAVAEVVSSGSRYYTLAYVPGNSHWDGGFRKIKVKLANNAWADAAGPSLPVTIRPPFHLEYREGYYAQPLAPVAPVSAAAAGTRKMISYSPKGDPKGPGVSTGSPLKQAMVFGGIAPFQILFRAHVAPGAMEQRIKRHDKAPAGNYLSAKWLHSPYRSYEIHYSVDSKDLHFLSHSVDHYHDSLEFIAVVYDDYGELVNSIVSRLALDLDPDHYMQAERGGVGFNQTLAVPEKGHYFLRLGVRELTTDHIGALEVPAESIRAEPTLSSKPNGTQ